MLLSPARLSLAKVLLIGFVCLLGERANTLLADSFGSWEYVVEGEAVTISKFLCGGSEAHVPAEIGGFPVTKIAGFAFTDCPDLVRVTFPASLRSIGLPAVSRCPSLMDISVDSGNPVFADLDGVLFNKSLGTLIQFPAGRGGDYAIPGTVTSIATAAFYQCGNLTGVTFPDSLDSIGRRAFFWCINLNRAIIPASVTQMGRGCFGICVGLTEIQVEAGNPAYVSVDGILYEGGMETLLQFPPGRGGSFEIPDTVSRIGADAFNAAGLTQVLIPGSVIDIEDNAFANCEDLSTVIIPESVLSLGDHAFAWCDNLTRVYFNGDPPAAGDFVFLDADPVLTIRYFADATAWGDTFADIPTVSFDYAFRVINGGITITRFRKDGSTAGIPSGLGGLPVTAIGDAAFIERYNLTSVTIPDTVTSIGFNAFNNCQALASISIPDTVTSIGQGAFSNCLSLASVILPEGLSSVEADTFSDCSSLVSLVIPNTVTRLGATAFRSCSSLLSLYLLGPPPETGINVFANITSDLVVYYIEGTPDWEESLAGKPTAPFDPDWLWGKYPVTELLGREYVDTGNWMEWMEVSLSPWIQHLATGDWFRIAEPVAAAEAGWIFVTDLRAAAPDLLLLMVPESNWGFSLALQKWLFIVDGGIQAGRGWAYLR